MQCQLTVCHQLVISVLTGCAIWTQHVGGPLVRAHQRAADLMHPSGACPHNCGYKNPSSWLHSSKLCSKRLHDFWASADAASAVSCTRLLTVQAACSQLPSCGPVSFDGNKPRASLCHPVAIGGLKQALSPAPVHLASPSFHSALVECAQHLRLSSHCLRPFPADETSCTSGKT